MTLSTRIGVMNAGRIIQVGEPPQVYEYPNSRFVADFVGTVNLFEGRVIDDEPDSIRLGVPDLPVAREGSGSADTGGAGEIYVGHGVSCTLDQTLWYAVRPEKMRLTRTEPDARNAYPVWVEDVAYMGNLSVYRLKLPGGRYLLASKANLSRWEEDTINWGEHAWVWWDDTAGVVLAQ